MKEGDYFYRMAELEKALCDKLYMMSPVSNRAALYTLLTADLRIDREALLSLNSDKMRIFCDYKHQKVLLITQEAEAMLNNAIE